MPSTKRMKVLRGKRIRVTRLDECGTPEDSYDSCGFIVSKGFVTVNLTAEVEEGQDYTQVNADGDLCISEKGEHNFLRWTGSLELCDVDPELVGLMAKVALEYDEDGNVVGYRSMRGRSDVNFAFELWSGISDDSCPDKNYGYFLLPWVTSGTLGDIEIGNDVATFTVENWFTRAAGNWNVGPYDVVPDNLGEPTKLAVPVQEDEHHIQRLTTIKPPEITTSCQPLPS